MANDVVTEHGILAAIMARDISIKELINDFQRVNDKNIKACILFALGELRAEKAIPLLISNINFEPEDVVSGLPKYPMPAATALGKIGIPTIKPILECIKLNADTTKATYLYYAIISINGAEFAISLLEKEIKSAASEKDVKRLNYVLSMVKEQYSQRQKALRLSPKAEQRE